MGIENLRIWGAVESTDPAHTKQVNKGGHSITAIDAYQQIRKATEMFGPAGIGWGWSYEKEDVSFVDIPTSRGEIRKHCLVTLKFWHEHRDKCFTVTGGSAARDSDCVKSATTDGITKALSYLGFNADVFLGAFDGNKYLQPDAPTYATAPADPQGAQPSLPHRQSHGENIGASGPSMAFDTVSDAELDVSIAFGKHKGRTWRDLATSSEGRSWLDFIVGPKYEAQGRFAEERMRNKQIAAKALSLDKPNEAVPAGGQLPQEDDTPF